MSEIHNFRDRVSLRLDGLIADVRLARPEKRNALDGAMFEAIADVLSAIARSKARAVILSGEGDAFCAGLDRAMFSQMMAGEVVTGLPEDLSVRTHGDANLPQHAVMGWRALDVPVICALHGAALGGGFQVALGADIRIVGPDTRIAVMEMRWGLVPDMGAFVLLPSLMRDDQLRSLVYSGRELGAEEALALGLVTAIAANPMDLALQMAREIAQASPSAIRAAKRLANMTVPQGAAILLAESREQMALMGGEDQMAVIAARLPARA